MPTRMIDQIRTSSAPATLVRMAARGALAVPAVETIEILVYLAKHNENFSQQATLTLAGWDENASKKVAADPAAPKEILDYWTHPQNLRPGLLGALASNPSVSEGTLEKLVRTVSGEPLDVLLNIPRVTSSPALLRSMQANLNLSQTQAAKVKAILSPSKAEEAAQSEPAAPVPQAVAETSTQATPETPVVNDAEVSAFLKEHAAELAHEGEKPFQPIGGIHDESGVAEEASETAAAAVAGASAPANSAPVPKQTPPQERGSVLQKIAALNITGRIQLAMKGTKEERSLLIRDGTKIVALAVLQSPKISDGEVEKFASQKNVLEAVLRAIPMKRQFAKNYTVIRNLVANPRTPLDVALGLMKNLMANDLKALSGNKEVSETIRKLALRQFKQKTEEANKK